MEQQPPPGPLDATTRQAPESLAKRLADRRGRAARRRTHRDQLPADGPARFELQCDIDTRSRPTLDTVRGEALWLRALLAICTDRQQRLYERSSDPPAAEHPPRARERTQPARRPAVPRRGAAGAGGSATWAGRRRVARADAGPDEQPSRRATAATRRCASRFRRGCCTAPPGRRPNRAGTARTPRRLFRGVL
jgi:hypothetical protein